MFVPDYSTFTYSNSGCFGPFDYKNAGIPRESRGIFGVSPILQRMIMARKPGRWPNTLRFCIRVFGLAQKVNYESLWVGKVQTASGSERMLAFNLS